MEIECEICGKTRYEHPNMIKKGFGRFCSKKCYGLSRKNKTHIGYYGKEKAEDIKRKVSKTRIGINANEKHGLWKGNDVGRESLHAWIKRRKPKPEFCERCGKKEPKELSNNSGKYKRDINDFEWLCISCHRKKDYKGNQYKRIGS